MWHLKLLLCPVNYAAVQYCLLYLIRLCKHGGTGPGDIWTTASSLVPQHSQRPQSGCVMHQCSEQHSANCQSMLKPVDVNTILCDLCRCALVAVSGANSLSLRELHPEVDIAHICITSRIGGIYVTPFVSP